jgi:hypothetical protein
MCMTQDDKGLLGIDELYKQFADQPYQPRSHYSHGKFKLDPLLGEYQSKFTLDPLYNEQVSYEFVPDPLYLACEE